MELLKRICEGFVYGGFDVYAQETDDLPTVHKCQVCGCKAKKYLVAIVISDKANSMKWTFSTIHAECLPWTDQDRAQWITKPYDPLTPYKGLTMICRAFASNDERVFIRQANQPAACVCFVCQKRMDAPYAEFALTEHFICAQLHNKCAVSFEKERDLAVAAHEQARAWKIWAISFLGDCRIIIARFLVQLPFYKEVFDAMY
jgi:hypothetical protein